MRARARALPIIVFEIVKIITEIIMFKVVKMERSRHFHVNVGSLRYRAIVSKSVARLFSSSLVQRNRVTYTDRGNE